MFWEKQAAVNEVFYSRFKFKYSSLFRSFSTREWLIILQPLIVSAVLPRSISSKICISHLVYKSMHEFEWYRVTYRNGLEEHGKGLEVF